MPCAFVPIDLRYTRKRPITVGRRGAPDDMW